MEEKDYIRELKELGEPIYKFQLNRFQNSATAKGLNPSNVDDYHFSRGISHLDGNTGIVIAYTEDMRKDFKKTALVLSPIKSIDCQLFRQLLSTYKQGKQPNDIMVVLDKKFQLTNFYLSLPKDTYKKPKVDNSSKEYEGFLNFGIF